jgi:hypothetical protein
MVTISVQQLHDETERFVRQAGAEEIQVEADGRVLAVLSRPPVPAEFEAYWRQREQTLARVSLRGEWDSTLAVSQDRGGP